MSKEVEVVEKVDAELVALETKPVIRLDFEGVVNKIKNEIAMHEFDALEMNDANRKELASTRAVLNNLHKSYNTARLDIRRALLADYDKFHDEFKKKIDPLFEEEIKKYDDKIRDIDNAIQKEKEDYAIEYYNKVYEAEKISFVKFSDIDIRYRNMKQTRDSIDEFFEKIKNDIKTISYQDDKDLIEAEYRMNGYDLQKAILVINERKALAQKVAEEAKPAVLVHQEVEPDFEEELVFEEIEWEEAELEIPERIKMYEVELKVKLDDVMLEELVEFLIEGGYEYTI